MSIEYTPFAIKGILNAPNVVGDSCNTASSVIEVIKNLGLHKNS